MILQGNMPSSTSTFSAIGVGFLLLYFIFQNRTLFLCHISTHMSHGIQIKKPNSNATFRASAKFEHVYKTNSTIIVSHVNSHHYFMHMHLSKEFRKRAGYQGLPITTKLYNTSYKNPCWYNNNLVFCLPYFFLGGFTKCGTTEVYSQLVKHPDIAEPVGKEPHWWTRTRFVKSTAQRYLEYLSPAANVIKDNPQHITLDGSPSTIWDNSYLFTSFGNYEIPDPSMYTSHYIHLQLPQAKCVAMVRDPVRRLYSGYLHVSVDVLHNKTTSPAKFHSAVKEAVAKFKDCLNHPKLSHMHCVYARLPRGDFLNQVRVGLYHIHLQIWLTAFPADQLMVIRLEDFARNSSRVLEKISTFLGVKHIHMEDIQRQTNTQAIQSYKNDNTEAYNRVGQMLDETKSMLIDFYTPYNTKLAELLSNKDFLFHDT